jgi:sarcosine oxidase subunit alpha
MSETITLFVNGRAVIVPEESTAAAAVAQAGAGLFRRSVSGEARAPLCGMGVCFECRVTINGQAQARSCQIVCRSGMEVRTDE